jgi:hypothetical protein
MRRTARALVAATALLSGAGCTARPSLAPTVPGSAAISVPALPPASAFAAEITNPWYPLKPGSKWVYEGVKGGQPTVGVFEVTGETKVILGIVATVANDQLTSGGQLLETTQDWFAQDKDGNVWYLGEATRALDASGQLADTEGSWEAGVDGALPGILMPADPVVGMSFKQESYPGHAEDSYAILSLNAPVTVPFGTYTESLLTEERTPLEPDVVCQKSYVKGLGLVFENDVTGPTEYNKLTSYVQSASEAPLPAETNPPGDIPDTQVFVAYSDPSSTFEIEAPEGWARTSSAAGVQFVDKLDGESIALGNADAAPTAAGLRESQAADLARSHRAVWDIAVTDVVLESGPAVLVSYTLNSDPNPVSGRQVRLEARRYFLYRDGRLATLTLWAPQGADNLDQWQRIADSFRWLP